MRRELQLETFRERGWILLPALFSADELKRFILHIRRLRQPPPEDRALYSQYPFKGFIDDKCLDELRTQELQGIYRMMRMHLFDEVTRSLMLDRRLMAIARAIFAADEVYGAHSIFLPKVPGAPGTSLHTDNLYFNSQPSRLLGMSIALEPSNEETGALEFVDRSHLSRFEEEPAKPLYPGEVLEAPPGETLTRVDTNPGDVIVFDGAILHGSRANSSNERSRASFVFHYVPEKLESIDRDCLPLYRSDGSTLWLNPSAENMEKGASTL